MTLQELFDAGLFGIRGQNYELSYDSGRGQCMYRGPNDCKCHVGHSIRDRDYNPVMEGLTADEPMVYALFTGIHEYTLREFQGIHDDVLHHLGHGAYEQRMQQFANLHKLRYTPVPK